MGEVFFIEFSVYICISTSKKLLVLMNIRTKSFPSAEVVLFPVFLGMKVTKYEANLFNTKLILTATVKNCRTVH